MNDSSRLFIHMERTHHLSSAVKRNFFLSRSLCLGVFFIDSKLSRIIYQCTFGRFSRSSIISRLYHSVAAQSHSFCQKVLIISIVIYYSHLVLSQSSSLVRADDLGASQCFHRSQFTNDGISLTHVGNAYRKNYRHYCCQSFRYRSDSQAHSYHKYIEYHSAVYVVGSQQTYGKYYSADHKDQYRQYLAQLTQFYLERRLAFFGLSKSVGDLSHLGVHSCLTHHRHSSSVHYSTSHVDHISAVSQGYLFLISQIERVFGLIHRNTFTCKGGLFYLHAGTLYYSSVSRNCVSCFQHHYISRNQFFTLYRDQLSVPIDFTGGRSHLLQSFYCFLRLAFLIYSQDSIYYNYRQNYYYIGKALFGIKRCYS